MLCQRLRGICVVFSPDAQKAYIDDTVVEYGCLIQLSAVHKVPHNFFRIHGQLLFLDFKSTEIAEVLLLHLPSGVIFSPTVSTSLSVLHQRLSEIQNWGVSVLQIPRGSGRKTQGYYRTHINTQFCCGTLRSCWTPSPRGCICRQVSFLREPTAALKGYKTVAERASLRNFPKMHLWFVLSSLSQLYSPHLFLTPVFYFDLKTESQDTCGQPGKCRWISSG